MTSRSRWLLGALGIAVVLLFAGRWTAALLADRWWAAQISPAAVSFLTQWRLFRLTLDLSGVLLAATWFVGHFIVVYRAIGSVQVPRQLANLEIREALTPKLLLVVAVTAGVVLGLVVGLGTGRNWQTVALAWQGASFGISDPLLRQDFGVYLAQLPFWRFLHGFAVLLAAVALIAVFCLYIIIGSVRWIDGRPAISDYARAHLGWLLVALALCLSWGYLLEPYEMAAGLHGPANDGAFGTRVVVAHTLAGTALAVALLSGVWARAPRHALVISAWTVLTFASLIGHHLVPSLASAAGKTAVEAAALQTLERFAFGVTAIDDTAFSPGGRRDSVAPPRLWHRAVLSHAAGSERQQAALLDPAVLLMDGRRRPVWFLIRPAAAGGAVFSAVADDRTTSGGIPISYRVADTLGYPGVVDLLELPRGAVRPGAPEYVLHSEPRDVLVGALPRRLVLAWARQVGELLGEVPANTHLAWHLDPVRRLQHLAPYAVWGRPSAHVLRGRLFWMVDGYLTARSFPVVSPVQWGDEEISSVRTAFVGTIEAATGETHIYLRHIGDPIARAWEQLAHGVIEPAADLPAEARESLAFPPELFIAQARLFGRSPWNLGRQVEQRDSSGQEFERPEFGWDLGGRALVLQAAFEDANTRRISALLQGRMENGSAVLRLIRINSLHSLPSPPVLENKWGRFVFYGQLRDSVQKASGEWETGPVYYQLGSDGLRAHQPSFALRSGDYPSLAWVSVEVGERGGGGRALSEAWRNLQGAAAPTPPGSEAPAMLVEARNYLLKADSALRRGNWAAFGQAWDALRRVLGVRPDTFKP